MAETDSDVCIRITLVDLQGKPLGGTVDLEFKPQTSGDTVEMRGVDASKDIDVSGLQRTPIGLYQLTVTPTNVFKPVSQFVTIPASGFATLTIAMDNGSGGNGGGGGGTHSGPYTLQGNLVFDHGLPAAGITARLYNVAFGGQDTKLGEVKSNAQGNYSFSYTPPASSAPNLQVRVLDPTGAEVTISNTKFNATTSETLNLIVPAAVQPLASEFQRLATSMVSSAGGVANLGLAQENSDRQDLTLLNQSTNWDARLVAFAATAAQQSKPIGLGQDVLYALFRVGLPSDPALLAAVPSTTVQTALTKASQAGIVFLNDQQIAAATTAFQTFASTTLATATVPGGLTNYNTLLAQNAFANPQQQAAFANQFFSPLPAGTDLWTEVAKLGLSSDTVNSLKLQGKFLYLTFNNAPLAQKLKQDIGAVDNLSQLADKDYHLPATWNAALTELAGSAGGVSALIPPAYNNDVNAYTGDLARKVRVNFPTRVVARMAEGPDLKLDPKVKTPVATFLRSASALGYNLGRTPLNTFLAKSGSNLPALDGPSTEALKTLHRLFQITPSTESLQAATNLGLTSAFQIASYSKIDFLAKYGYAFPSGEAEIVYGQAQTISSVTFNFFSIAKQLDTAPPLAAVSGSSSDRQNAKNSLVQQFPSMASLFGNMDFCQCEDCRAVLSPAAYFVDLLDLLGTQSAPNAAKNTPLDVLIGNGSTVGGRRPDLGALPLTCENTNTAMPYIDLVNEILEYYIANTKLDANAAYDTGTETTADLVAEPQHILPGVYTNTLKAAHYPLNLPFDLWIETVRGFLNYFKTPLAQVLDTLSPADTLELFTSNPATAYYRSQILAEALGLSPAEYALFTAFDTTKWFNLYAPPGTYADENAAKAALKNAKALSQQLGISYQDLADLLKTGFLNPGLYPLIFQFERFGIDMGSAFSFTGQPGYLPLSGDDATSFAALLQNINNNYPGFDAATWLKNLLPANYSAKVLVLADPDTGCNFGATTVQYADKSDAQSLDFLKLNLFVRLWKKLGWSMDETDRALQVFFLSGTLPVFTDAGFAAAFGNAWKTALVYLAHLDDLNTRLAPALGRNALLPLWSALPTQGESPLYSQLFLTPSVLNNDSTFDDPNGVFPTSGLPAPQAVLSAHSAAVQGVLSLTTDEITAILADAGIVAPASFSLANLSICYRYSLLAQCLLLSVADMLSLKAMSSLNPFQPLGAAPLTALKDDFPYTQTLAFVKQAAVVQNSGFTVEDLKYLLRHQFDPVGKYQDDPNTFIALVQSVATALRQIQAQNTVPPNLMNVSESVIDQTLSGLIPAAILKSLFTQITNAQTYTASQASGTALNPLDFAGAPDLIVNYDTVTATQFVSYTGYLFDWRKAELILLNQTPGTNALLTGLLNNIQQMPAAALDKTIADVLGVWASLVQYEAVTTTATPIVDPAGKLAQADASLTFTYDPSTRIQWVGYRGVLTDAKQAALTAIYAAAPFPTLLTQIQSQALSAYEQMTSSLLATWCNVQAYKVTQAVGLTPIDVATFTSNLAAAQQAGTITDPVPNLQFTYDAGSQMETLTCGGVLTQDMETKLAALLPDANLAALLTAARGQAVLLFQTLVVNLLAVSFNNPDTYLKPSPGVDRTKQPKLAKAALVTVFLPLLARKLSRQLVLQTLSSNLGSDPALTEALVTDAALLNDPNNPGESLLQEFLAVAQNGVSASYYTSADLSGTPQATGVALTADTNDPSNKPGTLSCHFEGYLQAPTDGPYRFFAELGNQNAQVVFRVDSPDPAVLFPNPLLQATASKNADEASQFLALKGATAYHFSLDLLNLGVNGSASLLIQGENLPKGPLSQIRITPQSAIDGFSRAEMLLSKVLRILQVTGLDEREVTYLTQHASQFSNLDLSSLPTRPSDDSLPNATALFTQFLTLADYADLRKGPAGATDGLIDVFQAAATPVGILATYYVSTDETGAPLTSGIALTADTTDPSNSIPGAASSRFEGYLQVPVDGPYTFFAELGAKNAQITLRLDAPSLLPALTNPILQHTAAADGEEASGSVSLKSGIPYHLTVDLQVLGGKNASLLVQGGALAKGPLSQLLLYPISQVPPWTVLANLTRRDPKTVRDVATALGPDPHFSNNAGIRRMWNALQLVKIIGLPPLTLSASTAIVAPAPPLPDAIAATFKNAVKAQYTADQWRPIAKSIFDPLRQKKRDALVSYIVALKGFESSNQLFEYFLVDPAMEPVVQTSRLRLALSSVQTFIQRCFLNLENANTDAGQNVAPSAIPADWWPWMKRYRVWQANREVFLFPENWMEPELRMDKTDLFQALESALLQGDVTNDLVEDAFLAYLKGLDLRARLDIVASYLDQDPNNLASSTLYVLGRTYGHPHKYFFHTYSSGSWSGWQTVTPDIEGDHMVLAIWRGRLNLFWITFVVSSLPPSTGGGGDSKTTVSGLLFNQLSTDIFSSKAQKQVQIQLHWSEFVQGKWTNRVSTDVTKFTPIDVDDSFDVRSVHIHVSKEFQNNTEGAVRIHVDLPSLVDEPIFIRGGFSARALSGTAGSARLFTHKVLEVVNYAFRVTSKNCDPVFSSQNGLPPTLMPYDAPNVDATFYTGSNRLTVTFLTDIQTNNTGSKQTENILNNVQNFDLLTCGNPVSPPFLDTGEPLYADAGSLVSPFFFKDTANPSVNAQTMLFDERTYFVQPSLTETELEQYNGWAVPYPTTKQLDPNLINGINVIAQVPAAGPVPINPGDPVYSVFPMQNLVDWVTNPTVAVSYGGVAIGQNGLIQSPALSGVTGVALSGAVGARSLTVVGKQGITLSQVNAAQGVKR